MSNYSVTVPDGAQSFTHDGKTYHAGNHFKTDNPCAILDFYQSIVGANPDTGPLNGSPHFWQKAEAKCPGGPATTPAPATTTTTTTPAENATPPGSDSPSSQGAPDVSSSASGTDTDAQSPGSGGDAPTAEEPPRPPQGQPHPNRSGERPQVQTNGGDPVELFTGTHLPDGSGPRDPRHHHPAVAAARIPQRTRPLRAARVELGPQPQPVPARAR